MFSSLTDLYFIEKHKPMGHGGFSQVHKVINLNDQKIYALKEINLETLTRFQIEALKREIKIHQQISHQRVT
jgi:serine/threonine protein kinase